MEDSADSASESELNNAQGLSLSTASENGTVVEIRRKDLCKSIFYAGTDNSYIRPNPDSGSGAGSMVFQKKLAQMGRRG